MLGNYRLTLTDLLREYVKKKENLGTEEKEHIQSLAGVNAMYSYFHSPLVLCIALGMMIYYSIHNLGNGTFQAIWLSFISVLALRLVTGLMQFLHFRYLNGKFSHSFVKDFTEWLQEYQNPRHDKLLPAYRSKLSSSNVNTVRNMIYTVKRMDTEHSLLGKIIFRRK